MKYLYTTAFFMMCLLFALEAVAQLEEPRYMVRITEDNDFLNLIGGSTDRSYTNGSRIEFFHPSRLKRHSFLYKILPTAGDSSINVAGWSLTQLMVTPENISTTEYQPNDYRYAGSLFVTRSFHSYNPIKKFSYQSELLVGIRGPHALARQTQTALHAMINSEEPRGWHNQLDTQLLLNLAFTAEKNLFTWKNLVELNGGVQARVGSLVDAVHIYPVLRIGKMAPYFYGLFSRYGSYTDRRKNNKFQYYMVVKSTLSFVAYNAMLKGARTNVEKEDLGSEKSLYLARRAGDVQIGAVISYGNVGISYLLTRSSSYDKKLYEHRYGTVEICVRW